MNLINCMDKVVNYEGKSYLPTKVETLVPREGIGLIVDFTSWNSNRSRTDIFTPDPYQQTEIEGQIVCQRLLQHT